MTIKRQTKRFLLGLFYHKLWVEIAVLFVIIVAIPLTAMGILLITTSQQAVRDSVLHEHREIAARAAKEIELFIKNPTCLLNTTASALSIIYPAPWKQETLLVETALNQPIFMNISSLNLDGKIIASSELGRGPDWNYPEDILKEVNKSRGYVSKVKILDSRIPYLTIAVPIKKMGSIIGVLIADVNLRGMWDIVDKIRVGRTGRAFLVSNDGILIAHEDKKRVLKNENVNTWKDVKLALGDRAGAIELKDEYGNEWISSYASIPEPGWAIILRQKQQEAYSFARIMKAQSRIIIALSLLITVLVSIFMARTLVKPIKSLVLGTKNIAQGNLDYKLGVRRRDEIGELIRSFNDMSEQLKKAKARERLSAIGEAAAWIAHELKNSLVAIKSFVLLFPKKHDDKKFIERFSSLVPDEIERWERMLKDLSGFSYQSELRTAETDIKALIDNVLEIMRERFNGNKVSVSYRPQEGNFYITADEERLKQVFTNLFINAINAMPKGGSLNISLHAGDRTTPEFIEVGINDTGKGISSDELDKIFEPFHTTNKDGMGLGLAISRRIIQQHGGEIRVESKIGEGSTFIVRLPRRGADEGKDNFSR